jgi:beta-phosphoglucomutase-like phosphatase (HAD superfamily)
MEEPTIDAEYMNRWLGEGSQIESLAPKTLYDVQTLIEYYRDIIVPDKKVSIAFPTNATESPRACVSRGEVIIPFNLLQVGRVDETIGAMIHELHHIKLTPSEKFYHKLSFQFLRTLMEQIDCYGLTLAERVFTDSSITMDKILGNEACGADISFIRKVLGDLLFLINAVEDVRIDANTPPNLRKYIDKIDKKGEAQLLEAIKNGSFSNESRDLVSIGYMILMHHKGMHKFPYIESTYGDTQGIIDADALSYPTGLFTAYKEEIASHIYEEYIKHCGMPPDAKQSQNGDDSEFDINGYFGGKVNHSIGDSLDEQLDKTTVAKHEEAQQDAEKSAVDSAKELLKDLKVNTNQSMDASGKTVTSMDISLNETTDSSEQSAPQNAQELRELLEKERENVVMSPGMVQQIKSFKNIRVHTATESFSDRTVTFDTVIFDATN